MPIAWPPARVASSRWDAGALACISRGLCAGIALWVHVLVLPFVLASGALLLIFCYREWRTVAIPCVLLGLLIGGFLLIPGYSAIVNALNMQGGGAILQNATPTQLAHLLQEQFVSTFLWGIPLTTWFQPICAYQDLPYLNLAGASPNLTCSLVQGGWSAGYLFLLGASLFMAALAGWRLWRRRLAQRQDFSEADQRLLVTQVARLLHLLTAVMVIVLYLRSPLSGLKPVSTRYLVGLLVATPGILWPLWQLTGLEKARITTRPASQWLSRAALILAMLVALTGTVSTLTTVPAAYTDAQQQQKLVQDLLHMHIRRVYLEYWTCYRLLFQSQEQILCARPPYPTVVGGDRYSPDARAVQPVLDIINPNVPFMFPLTPAGNLEITAFQQYNGAHHKHFRRYTLDGMALYMPISTG